MTITKIKVQTISITNNIQEDFSNTDRTRFSLKALPVPAIDSD
jgi:hypothetical protein